MTLANSVERTAGSRFAQGNLLCARRADEILQEKYGHQVLNLKLVRRWKLLRRAKSKTCACNWRT